MALVETYVDPDGTGDYTSLNAWEAGEQTDLVTDGDSHKVWCESSAGSADETAFEIYGWTTDSDHTLEIEGEDFGGKLDTNKYRLSLAANDGSGITIYQSYTTVKNIQVVHAGTSVSSDICIKINNYKTDIAIDGCLLKGGYRGIENNANNDSYVVIIKNNIIYDAYESGIRGGSGTQAGFVIINNTVYNCNNGASSNYRGGIATLSTNIASLKNNLCYDNHHDFGDKSDEQGDYNFSRDDTAYGANSIHGDTDGKTPDFVSTTSGSEDFNLQSTSDVINAGIGTTDSNVPATDINGVSRDSATCDIGAAEFVAAVTNILTNYYYTHLMQGGL